MQEQYSTNPFAYSENALSLTNLETGECVAQEPTQWRVFSESVAKHKNSDDLYSEAMSKISAPNAVNNVKETSKRTQEQTVASQTIGKVAHTDEEEAKHKQDHQTLFDKLISKRKVQEVSSMI